MMLCGMGKYGRVMTQYIGIVYDVIFLLLVLGAAEAFMINMLPATLPMLWLTRWKRPAEIWPRQSMR